jgi:hypothetical protein
MDYSIPLAPATSLALALALATRTTEAESSPGTRSPRAMWTWLEKKKQGLATDSRVENTSQLYSSCGCM